LEWYTNTNAISARLGRGEDNRATIIALLETSDINVEILKQIWSVIGLEEVRHVSLRNFTILVRMVSLSLQGYQLSIESYRATATDTSVTLPPLSLESVKNIGTTKTPPRRS
jgi:hypothetical protein